MKFLFLITIYTIAQAQFVPFPFFAPYNHPATGGVTIAPTTAVVGTTLTATNNLNDPDGMGSVSYTWYITSDGTSCSAAIPGGIFSTYIPVVSDLGKYIWVTASYTDGLGKLNTASSASIFVDGSPALAYKPAVCGLGVTLTTVNPASFVAGTVGAYYRIAYTTLKAAANESINADGFRIDNTTDLTKLYVNTGSVATPNYALLSTAAGMEGTANIVVRGNGIYAGNTMLTGSDQSLYYVAAATGLQTVLQIRAYDNVNGLWGDSNDLESAAVPVNINFN